MLYSRPRYHHRPLPRRRVHFVPNYGPTAHGSHQLRRRVKATPRSTPPTPTLHYGGYTLGDEDCLLLYGPSDLRY